MENIIRVVDESASKTANRLQLHNGVAGMELPCLKISIGRCIEYLESRVSQLLISLDHSLIIKEGLTMRKLEQYDSPKRAICRST